VNILFWNLKGNKNEKWIADTIQENDVDIAIFAEYHGVLFSDLFSLLKNEYMQFDGYGACEKVTLICKKTINTVVRREQSRYTLYSCFVDDDTYNIIGLHLPAPPWATSSDRKSVIRSIVQDIIELEKESQSKKTVVIGDFNCNPFSEEIIEKDAFNAVLFKTIINEQEIVEYNEKKHRRFYNPVINYLSEKTQTFGSIYCSSGNYQLYWNSYDQVLVRKELIEGIDSVKYIKMINGKSLIKRVRPDETISDHLPLLVCVKKGV